MPNLTSDQLGYQSILRKTVRLPILLIVALSAVFAWELVRIMKLNVEVQKSDQVVSQINSVTGHFTNAETGLRGFLLTGREEFLDPYYDSDLRLPGAISELKALVSGNSKQIERVEATENAFKTWRETALRRIDFKRSNRVIPTSEYLQGKKIMDQVRAIAREVHEQERLVQRVNEEKANDALRVGLIVTTVLGLMVAGFLGWSGRKRLQTLSASYEDILAQQLEQNTELERQAWIKTGQSTLAREIQGEKSQEEIANLALSYIARYVGAGAGALYIVGNDQKLRLKGSFALSEELKRNREVISWGERLVGQVAAEARPITMTEVPRGYLQVASALGEHDSSAIIIAPLHAGEQLIGVIELGAMKEFQRASEFLEAVSEAVSIQLRSALLREIQVQLLQESKSLNEKLQVQQEELRVSNEELEEQSKALREAQARLENQQAELEQSNTQLEEQSQELENQRDELDLKAKELERANQYKSEFLANMSHELRTPLNSTLILAKLLADNPKNNLDDEQVQFAKTIQSSGNDLLELINDILDLSKVEAGKLDLHSETIRVEAMLQAIQRIFEPVAHEKEIQFEVEVHPEAAQTIKTDRKRLEQILKNLLSNALKFTDEGKVILKVSPQKGSMIRFSVTDTGIGIAPNQVEVIFDAFKQADGTTSRKFGGTGLGLSISRKLAALLGGTIEVESVPGKGSTFHLTIPTEASLISPAVIPSAPTSARPSMPVPVPARLSHRVEDDRDQAPAGRKTILVIEDEVPFAKILITLGHEQGYQVLVATTAAEGMKLAHEHLPTAVILDVALPDHTGLSVLDQLKDDPRTRHIPVHIISGRDYTSTAMEMGAIGYLVKPVKREQLVEAFERLEQKSNQAVKRVLIVEDNDVQRDSIVHLIRDNEVEPTAVATGAAAIEKLKKERFDCVVLDLTLSDMSGFELLERLASDSDRSYPPVIVYTGQDLTREQEEKLRSYSQSIIIKGARSPERLLDEVSLFLHQVESTLPAEKQKVLREVRNREKLFEGKTILVADDDSRNVFALMSALEPKGLKVEIAKNGREALEKLRAHPSIDLVLMDIMMPEMDGYEAIRQIRADSRLGRTPVIAVTAKAMATDHVRALESGANDYLAKPIDLEKLLSLIRVWIAHGRR